MRKWCFSTGPWIRPPSLVCRLNRFGNRYYEKCELAHWSTVPRLASITTTFFYGRDQPPLKGKPTLHEQTNRLPYPSSPQARSAVPKHRGGISATSRRGEMSLKYPRFPLLIFGIPCPERVLSLAVVRQALHLRDLVKENKRFGIYLP